MVKKVVIVSVLSVSALMAADGAKIYGAKCAECHGADGKDSAISGKAIAGDASALTKLTGYKAGTFGGDQKATMQASIRDLGEGDLKAVAEHVEKLN